MRASVQSYLSFKCIARDTRHTHNTYALREEKRRQNGFPVCRDELGIKRENSRDSTGTWRVKDTAKRITVEYHVRNRAIASTNSRFSNASIDREAAPLSPKLPCLPRWITSLGRSCTLKDDEKRKKIRSRLRSLPPPSCLKTDLCIEDKN